jgi:hypothetical protein
MLISPPETHAGSSNEPGGLRLALTAVGGWMEAWFWFRHGPWILDSGWSPTIQIRAATSPPVTPLNTLEQQ